MFIFYCQVVIYSIFLLFLFGSRSYWGAVAIFNNNTGLSDLLGQDLDPVFAVFCVGRLQFEDLPRAWYDQFEFSAAATLSYYVYLAAGEIRNLLHVFTFRAIFKEGTSAIFTGFLEVKHALVVIQSQDGAFPVD